MKDIKFVLCLSCAFSVLHRVLFIVRSLSSQSLMFQRLNKSMLGFLSAIFSSSLNRVVTLLIYKSSISPELLRPKVLQTSFGTVHT